MKNILYLGSQSPSRQKLLHDAHIPFKVLEHESNEQISIQGLSFEEYVLAIAQSKMRSLVLPSCMEIEGRILSQKNSSQNIFVLTADTLMRLSQTGTILGKPKDRTHARAMLEAEANEPLEIATGCCLEKMYYVDGVWKTYEKMHWTTLATAEFVVPSDQVETYLTAVPMALYCCGAGVVGGFGAQYLKNINGSHSSVIGLPMFELCAALKRLGFE